MSEHDRDTAGVIAPPPLIYLAGLASGWVLHKFMPINLLPGRWARLVGGVLSGFALALGGSAFATMHRAKTPPEPWEPTTAIVAHGPFRYTRNPIYLSFTLLYAGISAALNSLTMLLPLPVVLIVVLRGVIEREERYLEQKFGDEYVHYKQRVRRWI